MELWRGTSRFTVQRLLGAGGFGAVYQVHDEERDQRVALKLLQQRTASGLYYFKREFRLLADIVHPNLVPLFELFSEEGQWFFTMELVVGRDILTHVRAGDGESSEDPTLPPGALLPLFPDTPAPPPPAPAGGGMARRLRPVLKQLVEGVAALHGAGKLHRDIRPSNVQSPAVGGW